MRGREVQEKFYRLGNNVHLGEQLSTMVILPRDLILRFISNFYFTNSLSFCGKQILRWFPIILVYQYSFACIIPVLECRLDLVTCL